MALKHLSLFTGIGGIDIAAELAGIETVGQCEWEDYPTKVLEKHWPDIPRWRDIHDLTGDNFRTRTGLQTIDIISGGFPCQPFSTAGSRKGKADDRYLWPEMLRVISEIRPTWIVAENVGGFPTLVQYDVEVKVDSEGNAIGEEGTMVNREGSFVSAEVFESLEQEGYDVQPIIIPACGREAWHRRDRIFILAHTKKHRIDGCKNNSRVSEKNTGEFRGSGCTENVCNTSGERLQGSREFIESVYSKAYSEWKASEFIDVCFGRIWESEPGLGRVANGVPDRVDRLKCLGNAVVPQQIYPIMKAIAELEN